MGVVTLKYCNVGFKNQQRDAKKSAFQGTRSEEKRGRSESVGVWKEDARRMWLLIAGVMTKG